MAVMAFGLGLVVGNVWLPDAEWMGKALAGMLVALLIAAISMDRWFKQRWHAATLGRQGEEHVGQALLELERYGARVIHDLIGPIGNIDHIVIHTSGIYAIETKTWSREHKKLTTLSFDGRKIRRNGRPVWSDPVAQVLRAALWLKTHLHDGLGLNFKHRIEAIVVFPGWHVVVEREHPHVKVLSLAELVEFIKTNDARHLSPAQVTFFASRIEDAAGSRVTTSR